VLTLQRNQPQASEGRVHVRGVNLAPGIPSVVIEKGAGAPGSELQNERLFGTLGLGTASPYVSDTTGTFPLLLRDAATGRGVGGSVGDLSSGYFTLFVVEQDNKPKIMIAPDDGGNVVLSEFGEPGVQVIFYNMMPDASAEFSAGSLVLPPIAYSYVLQTILPESVTQITSNAGNADVDLTTGGYTIGATGSGSSHTIIALPAPANTPSNGRASIRFLNAVPGTGLFDIHQGDSSQPVIATTDFGVPSAAIERDALKYSFVATLEAAADVIARANALEVSAGRRYLYVVAPRLEEGSPQYSVLWLQE
jgi:hypothetical protein